MLTAYQQHVRLLLQDETFKWLRDADITHYVNNARAQVAAESECLPAYATLAISAPTQQYSFTAIVVPPDQVAAGVGAVLNVRMGAFSVASGQRLVHPRAWSWFQLYVLNRAVPTAGEPAVFAQQGQGTTGSLWINLPDFDYTLSLDTVCLPIPLVDDTTAEALPRIWTQAVPFYGAWLAMMTSPGVKPEEVDKMHTRYEEVMRRARMGATSQVLPHIQSQGPDLANLNRYGITPPRGAGGG